MTEDKMNDDTLEEMNWASVAAIQRRFNLGYATASKIQESVLKSLKTLRSKTRKEDAEIAKEYGSTVNKDKWSITHTMAGERIAQAILKKEEEEHG